MELDTTSCRHCGVPVAWCLSMNGNPIPIDPTPDPTGNVFVEYEDGRLVGRVSSKDDPRPRGVAFKPHFATCAVLNRRAPKKGTKPCKPQPPVEATLFDSL